MSGCSRVVSMQLGPRGMEGKGMVVQWPFQCMRQQEQQYQPVGALPKLYFVTALAVDMACTACGCAYLRRDPWRLASAAICSPT